jgi:hypothetical protein
VLVSTGNAVQSTGGVTTTLADVVDAAVPGSIPITGTVTQVVQATGQALIDAGNGQSYLVDGLTAAPGELVNITVGNAHVIGAESGQTPLIGTSVLSGTQQTGELLTVGAASNNAVLTVHPGSAIQDTAVGNVVGTVGTVIDNTVNTLAASTPLTGGGTGGSGAPLGEAVSGVVGAVAPVLSGGGGNAGSPLAPVSELVNGTVNALAPALSGGDGGSSPLGGTPLGDVTGGVLAAATPALSGGGTGNTPSPAPANPVGVVQGVVGGVTNTLGGISGGLTGSLAGGLNLGR